MQSLTNRKRGLIPFLFILSILIILIFGLIYELTKVDEKAVHRYQELTREVARDSNYESNKNGGLDLNFQITQGRFDAQKELLFIKNNNRMHLKLFAKESELVFDRQKEKKALFEKMKNVSFFMQEELYYLLPTGEEVVYSETGELKFRNRDKIKRDKRDSEKQADTLNIQNKVDLIPMQVLLFVEAKEATYHYESSVIEAIDVKIDRFLAKGHRLKEYRKLDKEESLENKWMSAIADKAWFSLGKTGVQFTAGKMKAIFHEEIEKVNEKKVDSI